MRKKTFGALMLVLGIIVITIAIGIAISDEPLHKFCQRWCWLNRLLSLIFGEDVGRLVLSSLWGATAALCFALGVRLISQDNRN